MPEYLSPGVYVEEIPSGLKAIEGVSTSTAAFVGRARRGTVPGYQWPNSGAPALPFTPTGGFVLSPDPSPVFVSSFPEFQRQFGAPLPIPNLGETNDYGYLGWAARAFFDNGGKRLFVARVVDPTDVPRTLTLAQGVVYRLVQSAAAGATDIFLESTRGLTVGSVITFKRVSDDQDALGAPALPATALGSAPGPFGLIDGDKLTITANGGAAAVGTINAKPATASTKVATFANLDGTSLKIRVGEPSEPVQTISFSSTDPFTPITAAAATAAEVAAVINRFASGAKAFVDGNKVVIETDLKGSLAKLTMISGPVADLGITAALNTPIAGTGNVADVAHVTVAELAALFTSPDFKLDAATSGALRMTTTATGAATSIKLDEAPGSGLLSRLGFGTLTTVSQIGETGIAATVKVKSYNVQSNSVTLDPPLTRPLDPNEVYALAGVTTAQGPKFIARSPGSWGEYVSVTVSCADRSPTRVTKPVTALATKVPVESITGFYVGAVIEVDHNGNGKSTHQVKEIDGVTRVLTIEPALPAPDLTLVVNTATDRPAWVRVLEIDITVSDTTGSAPTEVYRGLSWNQAAGVADLRRHYAWQINARSRLVWVQPPGVGKPLKDLLPGSEGFQLGQQPTTSTGFATKLDPGVPDTFSDSDAVWVGADNGPAQRSGIQSLKDLTEVRLIAAPGKTSNTIQLALISQCELLRYRFAILDGERDPQGGSLTSVLTHRNLYDSSFAAYYQPWVTVVVDGQNRALPPSGYLAGIYARTDNERGVWKAPANEAVFNVVSLQTNYTTGEQDLLNPRGVNLIRQFDIGGIRVWGARTLSSDPDVKYINVRRTLIYIEASIDRGTQWVVFEPNAPETWDRVTASVSAFLETLWNSKALFGRSMDEAFYVRCDEATMTSDDILNGRLVCEVGVAIVRPAEFVIFRIQQITDFGAK